MKQLLLLSGGLDSTLILAQLIGDKKDIHTLCFDYGQQHRIEIEAAEKIAAYYHVPFRCVTLDRTPFIHSPLHTGTEPHQRDIETIKKDRYSPNIVPGRNTLFLAYALAIAESEGFDEIYFGANASDRTFPDCCPDFMAAFQQLLLRAIPERKVTLHTPLVNLTKREIINKAIDLSVPVEMTRSCYAPIGYEACGSCDACILRASSCAASSA